MVAFVRILSCLLLSVLHCLSFAASQSIDTDTQQSVYAGNTVNISCYAQIAFLSADWVRTLLGETEEKEICLNTGICPNGYAKRLSVDTTKNFTLTIRNVTVKDTGLYTCIAYDDYTYHRYSTRLRVTDRLVIAYSATAASHSTSFITADTQQAPDEDWTVTLIAVAAATTTTVCLLIIIAIVVAIKFKGTTRWPKKQKKHADDKENVVGRDQHNTVCGAVDSERSDDEPVDPSNDNVDERTCCTEDLEDITIDDLSRLLDADKKDKLTHEHDSVSEPRSAETKSEEVKAIACMSVDQENRLLLVTVLKLFRGYYNGSNNISAASKAFELLANTSGLWWNKLTEKNAAKRRVRRLIYYESSGYSGKPVQLNLLLMSPTSSRAVGVAVLDGKIYVTCKGSNKVRAGQKMQDEILVDGMKCPVDIVACKSDQSLYIADEKLNCIWRVPISGKVVRLQDLKELVPKALSLRNGALLVTASSNVLVKISRGGKILATIVLQDLQPLHAVETSASTFVVCCKLARGSQVVEVGLDGREIRRFVCVLPMLRLPSYLVLDQAGRLLVADSSNNRILLLDAQLTHGCAILNQQRDGIVEPHRLCLDENTGRLMVAHHNSNCVQTFDVKIDGRLASSVSPC